MSDTTVSPETPSPSSEMRGGLRRKLLVGLLLGGLFLAGLAGGSLAYFGPDRLMAAIGGGAGTDPFASGVPAEGQTGGPAQADAEPAESGMSEVFLMEDHIVNLVGAGSGPERFVRVRLAVVYDPALMPIGTLQERKAHLRDAFHGFLSQLTERDLEGSYGLTMLKEELKRRAVAVAGGRGVREVLITDLVIQ